MQRACAHSTLLLLLTPCFCSRLFKVTVEFFSLFVSFDAEAGRQPVAVSPALCSYSRSHPKAEIPGRTRNPHSTSGQQTQLQSLTSRTSRSSFLFLSLDWRRSFLAVSRSSSRCFTWAERAARRSSICLCSRNCLCMISWSSVSFAKPSEGL